MELQGLVDNAHTQSSSNPEKGYVFQPKLIILMLEVDLSIRQYFNIDRWRSKLTFSTLL